MQANLALAGFLKALGVTLAYSRIKAGKKQKDVAAQVGISSSYLSQIESGRRNVNMKMLARIASRLDMKLTDLLQLTLDMLNERT